MRTAVLLAKYCFDRLVPRNEYVSVEGDVVYKTEKDSSERKRKKVKYVPTERSDDCDCCYCKATKAPPVQKKATKP